MKPGAAGNAEGKGLVLVVEDEKPIADLVRLYLTREGFGVQVEADGRAGLAAARRRTRSRSSSTSGCPTVDGTEMCRRLRADGDWTPVLFVTARDEEIDRMLGLELGADDYVTKPFSPRELVARVKAVLRRAGGATGPAAAAAPSARSARPGSAGAAHVAGQEVTLTTTEFDLLAYLMRRPGRVFPREQLLAEVWGYAAGGRHPYRRRPRRPAARQARRRQPDPDRPRRRLRPRRSAGRPGMTADHRPARRPDGWACPSLRPGARRGPSWPPTGPPTSPPTSPARRRPTLATRVALATTVVALVAVGLTGLVALGWSRRRPSGGPRRSRRPTANLVAAHRWRTPSLGRRAAPARPR